MTVFVHLKMRLRHSSLFQDEPNQLFVVKKSKSVDAVNKKLYNSVILLYLTILNNFILRRHAHQTIECAIAMKSNPI